MASFVFLVGRCKVICKLQSPVLICDILTSGAVEIRNYGIKIALTLCLTMKYEKIKPTSGTLSLTDEVLKKRVRLTQSKFGERELVAHC